MTSATAVTLGPITVEADDPAALAAFWVELIGGTISGSTEGSVFAAARESGGVSMFFQPRGGPRGDRQGQNLDLTVPTWTPAEP